MDTDLENELESETSPIVTTDTATATNGTNQNGTHHDQQSNRQSKKKNILLKGADDHEEDQDMEDLTLTLDQSLKAEPSSQQQQPSSSLLSSHHVALIPSIITPSPFLHHNDSGTADRYRSALQRVNASPMTDVEAWEAIMNECMSLYRTQLLPQLESERMAHKMMLQNAASSHSSGNAAVGTILPSTTLALQVQRTLDLEKKLDWVESCHGHLIKYFPYSSHYYVTAVEMLMARSALPFESLVGGEDDYSYGTVENWMEGQTPLQRAAAFKMDAIFEFALGVPSVGGTDGTGTGTSSGSGSGTGQVVNVARDNEQGDQLDKLQQEEALLGMCSSSVELWLLYIRKRTRDAKRRALQYHSKLVLDPSTHPPKPVMKLGPEGEDLVRDWVVEAYERALSGGAAFAVNNHLIWKQYLNHVKSWNVFQQQVDSLEMGGINHALHSRQKELLRSIYQRIVTLPMLGLDGLWKEYEVFEKAQSEQLAAALIEEYLPKYQHARSVYLERNRVYNIHELRMGRLATLPVDYDFVDVDGNVKKGVDEEEYAEKMKDEIELLTKWKRRCAYERTNPERLNASELTTRIRQYYKDATCCFLRHIEIWHEWSSWELLNVGGSGDMVDAATSGVPKKRNVDLAMGVLQLGQKHVPDSAFLAYANAKICEEYHDSESYRTVGQVAPGNKAIKVMSDYCTRAGNALGYVLLQSLVRKYQGVNEARAVFSEARRNLNIRLGEGIESLDRIATTHHDQKQETQNNDGSIRQNVHHECSGKIVMNRNEFTEPKIGKVPKIVENDTSSVNNHSGRITWHLYAAHATIEHRVNNLPKVAARVYELGLKKHRSFLVHRSIFCSTATYCSN
jgi:Pre-mRNA 3''-end processing (cleavage and polyadenylation) factor